MGWGEEEKQRKNKATEERDQGFACTALEYWAGL
jgi:hypothetical protein